MLSHALSQKLLRIIKYLLLIYKLLMMLQNFHKCHLNKRVHSDVLHIDSVLRYRHRDWAHVICQFLRSSQFHRSVCASKNNYDQRKTLMHKLQWNISVSLVSSFQFQTTINKIWDTKQTHVIPTGTRRQQGFFPPGKQLFYCACYVFRTLNNLSSELLKLTCKHISIYFDRKKTKSQSIFHTQIKE